MRRLLSLNLLIVTLLTFGQAAALPEDWEQEATILANSAEFDRKDGVIIYTGQVVLTQGTLRIESDRLVVHTKDQKLEKAIAQGRPARYQQQIQAGDALTHAEALTIEYLALDLQAVLIGQAKLSQEGNEMTGERIHYDMTKEVIQAGQTGDQPSRIKVVIQPQSKPIKGNNQ